MPRLILALIRHGEYHQRPDTPSAHQPYPLNDNGQAQSRDCAATLRQILDKEHWQLLPQVYCSDLLRAWQTAEILLDALRPVFIRPPRLSVHADLAERNLGSAANLNLSEIESVVARDPRCGPLPTHWKSDSHFRLPLPGTESLMQAGERVAKRLSAIAEETRVGLQADSLLLIVGHGAAFRHAAHLLGVLAFEQIARLSMFHAHPVLLEQMNPQRWTQAGGEWKQREKPDDHTD